MPKMTVTEIKTMTNSAGGYIGNDIDDFCLAVYNLQQKTNINANWLLALFYSESALGTNKINPTIKNSGGFKGIFQLGKGTTKFINDKFAGAGINYDTFETVPGARQVEIYEYFIKAQGTYGKFNAPEDLGIGNIFPAVIKNNLPLEQIITYKGWQGQAKYMYDNGKLSRRSHRTGYLDLYGTKFNLLSESPGTYTPNSNASTQNNANNVAEDEFEEVRYVDLNPMLKEMESNMKAVEKGYLQTKWGKKQDGEKYNWVGFKQFIMHLALKYNPGSIVPYFELIPKYQMQESNLNQATEDLRSNIDKVVDEVMQKYVGSWSSEEVLMLKRKLHQVQEKIPGYNETRYNNNVRNFNKLSNKTDLFKEDPWNEETNNLYEFSESGKKIWSKKNVGMRIYGQIVMMPEATDNDLSKAGEIGFESVTINMGNGATNGLSLIELKIKDVQGNKFNDINSPWSFLFDARVGTDSADFLFRYGWSIKIPPKNKPINEPEDNQFSNLFWLHEGWDLFEKNIKEIFINEIKKNNNYFLLTQSFDHNDYLWNERNSKNNVQVGITDSQSDSYMQLSLLNPQISMDTDGSALATIQFRTGAGLTRNCPLKLAYTTQNLFALNPNGCTLSDLVIAVDTDLKNNSIMVEDPAIEKKRQNENFNSAKKLSSTSDLSGILKVIGAFDYNDNDEDLSINPDSVIIRFDTGNFNERINNLDTTETLWSLFSDLLRANECVLLNFMNGSGLQFGQNYVIATTQPGAEPYNNKVEKLKSDNLKDILVNDRDILAYKHDSSLIESLEFGSNEKPNQFTIALNYRLGQWANFDNSIVTSTDKNNDQNKLHILDRKNNLINLFCQMMEVNVTTLCMPWLCPGRKIHLKGSGFNDGNYSCLEVTHEFQVGQQFKTNIRGVRLIPPGDKELEKSLSSPGIYDNAISSNSSYNTNINNIIPYENNNTEKNYVGNLYNGKILKPSKGTLSSRYGARIHPKTGIRKMHNGVDIACPIGTPVIAPESGEIILATFSNTAGNWLHIRHNDGRRSVFMHLSKFNKKVGDYVNKGELIAISGNTGSSTGPHLHYELYNINNKAINPESWWVEV